MDLLDKAGARSSLSECTCGFQRYEHEVSWSWTPVTSASGLPPSTSASSSRSSASSSAATAPT